MLALLLTPALLPAHPGHARQALEDRLGSETWTRLRESLEDRPELLRCLHRVSATPLPGTTDTTRLLLHPAWRAPVLVQLGPGSEVQVGPRPGPPVTSRLEVHLAPIPGALDQVEATLEATLETTGPWPEDLLLALPPDLVTTPTLELLEPSGVARLRLPPAPGSPLKLRARRRLSRTSPGPYPLSGQAPVPLSAPTTKAEIGLHPERVPILPFLPQANLQGFFLLPGEVTPEGGTPNQRVLLTEATLVVHRPRILAWLERIEGLLGPIPGQVLVTPSAPDQAGGGATQGGISWIHLPPQEALLPGDLASSAHELAHLGIDGLVGGPAPDGLREGLASLMALELLRYEPNPDGLRSLRGALLQNLLGTDHHPGGRADLPHQAPHPTLDALATYAFLPACLGSFAHTLGRDRFWSLIRSFREAQAAAQRGPDISGFLNFLEGHLREDRHRDALVLLTLDLTQPSTAARRQQLAWELYAH